MRCINAGLASIIMFFPVIASAEKEVRTWGDWELSSNLSAGYASCLLKWDSWRFEIVAAYIPNSPFGTIDDLSIEPKMLGMRALNIYPREQPIQIRVRLDDADFERTYSFERIEHSGLDLLELLDSSTGFLSEWAEGETITLTYGGDELVRFSQSGLASALDAFIQCRFEATRR